MIIVKLTGGLGNQMFQYAFGKVCSIKAHEPLFLDLSWYRNKNSKRRFLLDELNVSYDRYSNNRFVIGAMKLLKNPAVLKDNGFFEEKNLEIRGNALLEGSWESYKYFEAISSDIKKGFTLKKPSERFTELSRKIKKDSIAVHVRRGDYLIPHGKYLNGADYYNKGVERILKDKSLKDPQITIFSDDPKWCETELKSLAGQPTEVFDEKLDSDTEELMLMSLYGNNIISNSTFSWWAAYLNPHPDKTVVMPVNWFTEKERNGRYLEGMKVPEWIMID